MRPKSFVIIFMTCVYTIDIPTMGSYRDNMCLGGVGIKISWVEKNRKINSRGGTIIRDSRVDVNLNNSQPAFTCSNHQ